MHAQREVAEVQGREQREELQEQVRQLRALLHSWGESESTQAGLGALRGSGSSGGETDARQRRAVVTVETLQEEVCPAGTSHSAQPA